MEKNEHAIFLDIPSGGRDGKYHSAILTTYAIDLIHFDRQLLNQLHRKQICSVNVFVDHNQMEKCMEYINPIYMKKIGMDYCITNMSVRGAYHPKINFFVGYESVLVVFGTGNLTVTGHGKNHEAFTGFMIDENDKTHRPLIEECWQYITKFTKQCGEFERNRILHEIPDNCIYLDSSYVIKPHKMWKVQDGLDAALLYNEPKYGIMQQIIDLVPLDDVQIVTVISPYFDMCGESLISFTKICPNAKINVLIHEDCSLPPCEIPQNKRIVFYDFNETKRSKDKFRTYDRQLHAKIIHFKTSYSEFCVIGSANATIAGLGTMSISGINEEFCVLYHSKKKDFLSLLGLKTKTKLGVRVNNMNRTETSQSSDTNCRLRILSAQFENEKLIVCCNEKIHDEIIVAVDDGIKILSFKSKCDEKGIYVIETKLDKVPSTCYIVNKDKKRISNIVFINLIDLLETTNPSKTSRSLNRFISRIENEGYEGMEIADILSDIMWDLIAEQDESINPIVKAPSGGYRNKDNTLPEIKYNEEYDNDEVKSSRLLLLDRTSRLIECIEDSIRRKIRSIEDAIIDEEEEGTPETCNNREIDNQDEILVSNDYIDDYGNMSTSVLSNYQEMIKKRHEQVRNTGDRTITKDDMNFFSLSIFAAVEICFLNRLRYQFDEPDDMTRSISQKRLYDSLDSSIYFTGMDAIDRFVRFCKSMNKGMPVDDSYKKVTCRTMKYAILYGTLFYCFATKNILLAKEKQVLQAIRSLASIFGMPSLEYLNDELTPISERYDYVFRMRDVGKLMDRLNQE